MSSAGGSPTSAADGARAAPAMDGMELARRMVEAAEAAARAAEATSLAVQAQASQAQGRVDDRSWWKLLPKPAAFDHASRSRRSQLGKNGRGRSSNIWALLT